MIAPHIISLLEKRDAAMVTAHLSMLKERAHALMVCDSPKQAHDEEREREIREALYNVAAYRAFRGRWIAHKARMVAERYP